MSYEEIRSALQGLTSRERIELTRDLRLLEQLDDPSYITQLFQRLDELDQSKVTREAELQRILAGRTAAV